MSKWKEVVGTVAPGLATALGGPLAGIAASAISQALLGKPDAKEDELALALQVGGADALVRIKEAEIQFRARMEELGVDIERIHAQDRDSARKREAATGDSDTPKRLAYGIVAGFIATVGCITVSALWFPSAALADPVVAGFLGTGLGYLSAKAEQVVAYYFGSSAGSKAKDALIRK